MMWHLPTWNENATFFSILNSIIYICSAGYRNEGKLIKTFCRSMILKQTADVLKIFPSQYFACYIKSCEWIVLTEMIFLNDKLKWKNFPVASTQLREADPAQASALSSAFKWLNLLITKGPWALSCLLGFVDSSFSSAAPWCTTYTNRYMPNL